MIVVVHPPPSAKCGKTAAVASDEEFKSTTGNVVKRNSERSFKSPRSAITATAFDDVNISAPENVAGPKNGLSSKNAAICPFAGIVAVAEATSRPLSSEYVNDRTAGSEFGLAMARPLL